MSDPTGPYKFSSRDGKYGTLIKHISENDAAALQYIKDRASGTEKSVRTPWKKWNDNLTDGVEMNTINVLGARSGGGKTLTATQITRSAIVLNPTFNLAVLDLQFEMLGRNTSIRSLSKEMSMSVKKLKSADGTILTRSDIDAVERLMKRNLDVKIYEVNVPLDIDAIGEVIEIFSRKVDCPFLVTLDHALLVKRTKGMRTQAEKLEALGEFMTATKKQYDMIWFLLSQLNRNIYSMDRIQPFSSGNYPMDSDLFGADALLQHADNVILFDQPLKRHLVEYGPDRWILEPKLHADYLAIHLVKAREGNVGMWWMKLDGKTMNLIELDKDKGEYPFISTGS